MKRALFAVAILLSLAAPRFAVANDVWDLANGGPGSDDGTGTGNEVVNGTSQTHDLQNHNGTIVDQDWFLPSQKPYSSYEVLVDSTTSELLALSLDLVDSMGNLIQSATQVSHFHYASTLRFRNASASETNLYVRVQDGACGAIGCDTNSTYRIQFYETTYLIPRFNNSATQVTLMVIQNGSPDAVAGTARFWNSAGALLASQDFSLAPKGTSVINTSVVAGVAGQSGSITVDHDGRYGSLSGKAVAVEPATGFTFDTAMTAKIH
jgi:hypothetical protein